MQIFAPPFSFSYFEKLGVMKREKVSVRIIGNNEISTEEERVIWDAFLNFMQRKKIKETSENNKTVGSEEIIRN